MLCLSRLSSSDRHVSSCRWFQVLLTKFPSLPPTFEQTPNAVTELKLASKHLVWEIYTLALIGMMKRFCFQQMWDPEPI